MFHDDLAALEGTAAHAIATEDARDIREAYDGLPLELRARVSLEDFAWGCAIVQSRGFHAPGTLEHRIALLPLVDLLDHRPGDVTWTYDPLDGNLVVSTEHGFAIGDEVHFTYGDQSNTRLFVHFGFTLPDNAADEADLVLPRAGSRQRDCRAPVVAAPARLADSREHRVRPRSPLSPRAVARSSLRFGSGRTRTRAGGRARGERRPAVARR